MRCLSETHFIAATEVTSLYFNILAYFEYHDVSAFHRDVPSVQVLC